MSDSSVEQFQTMILCLIHIWYILVLFFLWANLKKKKRLVSIILSMKADVKVKSCKFLKKTVKVLTSFLKLPRFSYLEILFSIYLKIIIGYLILSTEFKIIFGKMAQSPLFLRDTIWVTSYLLCDVLISVILIILSYF